MNNGFVGCYFLYFIYSFSVLFHLKTIFHLIYICFYLFLFHEPRNMLSFFERRHAEYGSCFFLCIPQLDRKLDKNIFANKFLELDKILLRLEMSQFKEQGHRWAWCVLVDSEHVITTR